MARVKLSEVDAKRLLFPSQLTLSATPATTSGAITKKFGKVPLVVKVDQGIKKRGKQGLVVVGVGATLAVARIREWSDQGFSRFLIEPVMEHKKEEEKYLSFTKTRSGWKVLYGDHGGIDIEEHWDQVTTKVPPMLHTSCFMLQSLLDKYYLSSLEVNPLIMREEVLTALDAAAEIDDAALGLADLASLQLTPVPDKAKTDSELAVEKLDDSTPASLKFRLINPDGRIWMLLSGGGASIVLADEVADLGYGKELANYGEYSGAPTDDDTYSYAKIILSQLLKAKSSQTKSLVIAGGVANFTDVSKTFKGLIRAMDEVKEKLVKAKVKVFVRRGGPNEKKGLAMMEKFLQESNLLGVVYGHETPLTQVVTDAVDYLSRGVSSTGDLANGQVGTPKVGGDSPLEYK